MIIKRKTETEFYVPDYVTEEQLKLMKSAYDSFEQGKYKVVQPEEWKWLYESCIIWDHSDSTAITVPQKPVGKDLEAWLEHIWSHTEYYVGFDKHYNRYFVFRKDTSK